MMRRPSGQEPPTARDCFAGFSVPRTGDERLWSSCHPGHHSVGRRNEHFRRARARRARLHTGRRSPRQAPQRRARRHLVGRSKRATDDIATRGRGRRDSPRRDMKSAPGSWRLSRLPFRCPAPPPGRLPLPLVAAGGPAARFRDGRGTRSERRCARSRAARRAARPTGPGAPGRATGRCPDRIWSCPGRLGRRVAPGPSRSPIAYLFSAPDEKR